MKSFEEIANLSKEEFKQETSTWSRADCLRYLTHIGVPKPEVFYDVSTQNSCPIPIPYFKVGDRAKIVDGDDGIIVTVDSLIINSRDAIFIIGETDLIKSVVCSWIDSNGIFQQRRFYEDEIEKINAPE